MEAYVQISLASANERDLLEQLKAMPEVKNVHILFGEWDMIAKIHMDSAEALGKFVVEKIRAMPGVKLTSTMIIAK